MHDKNRVLVLPQVRLRRRGRAKIALLEGIASGMLNPGERVVVVSGDTSNGHCELDTIAVVDLVAGDDEADDPGASPLGVLRDAADSATFDAVLTLCVRVDRRHPRLRRRSAPHDHRAQRLSR